MALEQGRVFVGDKTYLVHVMIVTNSFIVEWLGSVHLINLNIPKKLLICTRTFAWATWYLLVSDFRNLTISYAFWNFCPPKV
jgi:hypothetical protein